MKTMTNAMASVLALGSPIDQVIAMSTWNPAKEIKRTDLGSLDVGAEADIAVLRLDKGRFGFIDSAGAVNPGTQNLVSELTLRKGKVVWDLNGRASENWKTFKYNRKKWEKSN
jgi:dihydroorotase